MSSIYPIEYAETNNRMMYVDLPLPPWRMLWTTKTWESKAECIEEWIGEERRVVERCAVEWCEWGLLNDHRIFFRAIGRSCLMSMHVNLNFMRSVA